MTDELKKTFEAAKEEANEKDMANQSKHGMTALSDDDLNGVAGGIACLGSRSASAAKR